MNKYLKLLISKVSLILLSFIFILVLGFSYAQSVIGGTGDRPDDWGDNSNNIVNQLLQYMNVDENGNTLPSGQINPAFTPTNNTNNNNFINTSTNNQGSPIYNVLPNANGEIVIPNTNINNGQNIQFNNNVNGAYTNANNYPCTVLRVFMSRGNSGTNVYALQTFLHNFGYLRAIPNGHFGPATEQAVKDFQRDVRVDIRGYVGPNTRAAIANITCGGNAYSVNLAKTPIIALAQNTIKTENAPNNNIKISTTNNTSNTINNTSVSKTSPNTGEDSVFKKSGTSINNKQESILQASVNTVSTSSKNINSPLPSTLSFSKKDYVFFSYKISSGEKILICLENNANKTCEEKEYTEFKDNMEGSILDTVKVGDIWGITVYNNNDWNQGGKLKIKSVINQSSNIYEIKISQ